MDWLLAFLAVFNAISMYVAYHPRTVRRRRIPWAIFGVALLAIELAWLWLPVQLLLAVLFCFGGALHSTLGQLALVILIVSWSGLILSIWQSTRAGDILEAALRQGLGPNYQDTVPAGRRETFRQSVTFHDWKNPRSMRRPGVEVISDIPYGPAGVKHQLDIYRPVKMPEGGCPVLLQIHGGAWVLSKKDDQALPLMYHLASRGWICVAINYRLSPSVGFPTHLLDCKKALCWIRENGANYGMDTSFVAVTGGSAGGHLAALVGLTANYPKLQEEHPGTDTSLQAAVPLYGIYDFLSRYDQHPSREVFQKFLQGTVMHETPEENRELWELASPISHIRADAPPFMILHGTHDSLIPVREGRVFAEQLREVSAAPVVYAEMPWAEHAWELLRTIRGEYTLDAIHRFLEWALARHRAQAATSDSTPSADAA